ncbi:DNA internalization-related competence protein ComEC/Rec2 [Sulfuriflexus mobilis]|uniref:DNA internalization-related competence protein ComEC/Rec2 n=1 Tax=Sulfuriflexus mobilis TaxID=1811807 RepID=UPI000F82E28E|nr:DNA internalization-related competence protein ComEC/Rec2 [Sulfuriflexus mobilis]
MRLGTIAFLLGILAAQQLTDLPDGNSWFFAGFALILLWFLPWPWRLPLLTLAGFLWALFFAGVLIDARLPAALEGEVILIEARVVSLPKPTRHGTRFDVDTQILGRPYRLRLNDYQSRQHPPHAGERWRLLVKLKQPHGLMNPGGFDYERYLFRHGIAATGYVRQAEVNEYLSAPGYGDAILVARAGLSTTIEQALSGQAHQGLVRALAVGDRRGIDAAHWQVLRRTGTSHLMAISGLHIGLVAGMVFLFIRAVCSRSTWLLLRIPAVIPAAVAAMLAAIVYAMLAGFSVPTQRALIMVCVMMLAIISRRQLAPSSVLAVALLLVLLFDPLAVLDAGFWLSFSAVAIIMYVISARLGSVSKWLQWGRIQWLIAVGMLPLMLILFQQLSLVAPIANLLAVPWVSFVTVPATLLGSLSLSWWPDAGNSLLGLATWSLDELWPILEALARQPLASWASHRPQDWTILPAALGMLWLLLPRGWPARWLGGVCLLPMLLLPRTGPAEGELALSLLDVGQGLSVVLRTAGHVLVYDTGARFSDNFDAGQAIIVPFLRSEGVTHIDTLLVSHGDNDHRGGADSLLQAYPVRRILSGAQSSRWGHAQAEACRAGQHWQWDGVDFDILHPAAELPGKANNRSCVLRVSVGDYHVLLPGDIETLVETHLQQGGQDLRAQILVAPHHGSKTSSSLSFLRAVKPEWVLFATGYRNRYGFPHPGIVQRYRAAGTQMGDTAKSGAIQLQIAAGRLKSQRGWRQQARRYWHAQ